MASAATSQWTTDPFSRLAEKLFTTHSKQEVMEKFLIQRAQNTSTCRIADQVLDLYCTARQTIKLLKINQACKIDSSVTPEDQSCWMNASTNAILKSCTGGSRLAAQLWPDLAWNCVPDPSGGATISLLEEIEFQKTFTELLAQSLDDGFIVLSFSLGASYYAVLQPWMTTSIGRKGLCRAFWGGDPSDSPTFVLQVGSVEHSRILTELAHGYILSGSLCCLTVVMMQEQSTTAEPCGFKALYSIYRRGYLDGEVHEPQPVVYKCLANGGIRATQGALVLNLADFFPAQILLAKYGAAGLSASFRLKDLDRCLDDAYDEWILKGLVKGLEQLESLDIDYD